MDLERMLQKCHRDQWKVSELNWNQSPRALNREQEIAVVQYFTDMSGIELLAGELFKVQKQRTKSETLREIFQTFVVDEVRHSAVAKKLADFYNVHHYQTYTQNPHLQKFASHFISACHHLSPEIANAYITSGELLLDIALLRSLDDYVDDEMSHQAMRLINRDESRHIAVDYHMVEFYASEEHLRQLEQEPSKTLWQKAQAAKAFAGFLYHARPFIQGVFFDPMDVTDPSGKRLIEVFKRLQLLSLKPGVNERPFVKFMSTMRDLFNHPIAGKLFSPVLERIIGLDPRVIKDLYTQEDKKRSDEMSIEEMGQDALAVKGQD
jgi:hypothetical protein